MTGHLLGGAGGVEAVATVLTIENGMILPPSTMRMWIRKKAWIWTMCMWPGKPM